MVEGTDIVRPTSDLIRALGHMSAATASGELASLGIRNPHRVGPPITLRFMPKREDIHMAGEHQDVQRLLHRQALCCTEPGDIVVDARGDMTSGVFGETMLTHFAGQGSIGIVVDGCVGDYPSANTLGQGLWLRGVTANFHAQTNILPHVAVMPATLAPQVATRAGEHTDRKQFSRMRLAQGGDLRKYYPLSHEARAEHKQWRAEHPLSK